MKKNIKMINNTLLFIAIVLMIIVLFVLFQYKFDTSKEVIIYSKNKNYVFYDFEKQYKLDIGDNIKLKDIANTKEEYYLKIVDFKEHLNTNEGIVYEYVASSLDDRELKETSYILNSNKRSLLEFILIKYL